MKKGLMVFSFVFILAFSITFVSAGWFIDFFNKNIQLSPQAELVEGKTYTITKGKYNFESDGKMACFDYKNQKLNLDF